MLPHSKESDFVLFLLGCGEISLASMTIFFEPLEPPVRNKNERSEFAIHYAEKKYHHNFLPIYTNFRSSHPEFDFFRNLRYTIYRRWDKEHPNFFQPAPITERSVVL